MTLALLVGPAVAGGTKCLIWTIGIAYSYRFRRALFAAACTLGLLTSVVRAIIDSGGTVPAWMVDGIVYWSTPTVALIVGAFVAGRYPPIRVGRGWRF